MTLQVKRCKQIENFKPGHYFKLLDGRIDTFDVFLQSNLKQCSHSKPPFF